MAGILSCTFSNFLTSIVLIVNSPTWQASKIEGIHFLGQSHNFPRNSTHKGKNSTEGNVDEGIQTLARCDSKGGVFAVCV